METDTQARATIIKVPDATPGLLVAGDAQHRFTLDGVWRSPAAPATNMVVSVTFDGGGAITAISAVDPQELARERMQQLGSVASAQGKQAASLAGNALSDLATRLGKGELVAAVAVWLGWFVLPFASIEVFVTKSWTFWDALAVDLANPLNDPGAHGLGSLLGVLAIAAPFAVPYVKHPRARLLLAAPAAFIGLWLLRTLWALRGVITAANDAADALGGNAGAFAGAMFANVSLGAGLFILPIAAIYLLVKALKAPGADGTAASPISGRTVAIGVGALAALGVIAGGLSMVGGTWIDAPTACQGARAQLSLIEMQSFGRLKLPNTKNLAASFDHVADAARKEGLAEAKVKDLRTNLEAGLKAGAQLACGAAGKSFDGKWECTGEHERVRCK